MSLVSINGGNGKVRRTFTEKLLALYERVHYIQKGGRNPNLGYSFLQEAELKRRLNLACRELGLFIAETKASIVASGVTPAKEGKVPQLYCIAHVSVSIADADAVDGAKTPMMVTLEGVGGGSDSTDKAPMKAVVSAFKYALANGLAIATGDDPEASPDDDGGEYEDLSDRIRAAKDLATLVRLKPVVATYRNVESKFAPLKDAYRARAAELSTGEGPEDGAA